MNVFTEVDGKAYPGTLARGRRLVSLAEGGRRMYAVVSYLSARLDDGREFCVEAFSEDEQSALSVEELKAALVDGIRKRLS